MPEYHVLGTGIGGGPSVRFKVDRDGAYTGGQFLKHDPGSVGMDHRATFIVASTNKIRGAALEGLVTGIDSSAPGAPAPGGGATSAYGNMFTLEAMHSHWSAVYNGSTLFGQSIYSNSYTGGDGGQYLSLIHI